MPKKQNELAGEPPVSHTEEVISALERQGDGPRSEEMVIQVNGLTLTLGGSRVYLKDALGHVCHWVVEWDS